MPIKERSSPLSGLLRIVGAALLVCISLMGYAQQVDIGNIGKQFTSPNPLKVRGSIAASAVGYTGDSNFGRDPLNYHLNGNLNISLFEQINMPFSFNFTNAGSRYSYPTLPNRLSLHPTYKAFRAHIGDVSMTYSPYTLNGILFRGVGLDVEPAESPWRISALYGRLQKAVAYDPAQSFILPTYKRMAYASKIGYEKANYRFGLTFFSANDDPASLQQSPDSLAIVPAKNNAISGTASIKVSKDLTLSGEYAISNLTRDKRDAQIGQGADPSSGATNTTKGSYNAWKANLDYRLSQSIVGLGYERIAPGYQTLGAYYFNNDFENFTFNYMQPLFKEKANIGVNLGLQRDDLDQKKASRTNRFIGSANLNVTPSERINASISYSNFQTHVNIKPQFDYINAQDEFYQADTLNFVQLSQNANANINYVVGNTAELSQNLNVNLSYQVASDEQGGVVQKGNASGFYSGMAAYSMAFPQRALQISTAFNYTHNTIGRQDTRTLGPTLGINKRFFSNKLQTGLSSSYNTSISAQANQTTFMNVRASASYTLLKKHNLGLNIINQNRKIADKKRTNDLTVTFSYNYAFSVDNFWTKKEERKKKEPKPEKMAKAGTPSKADKRNATRNPANMGEEQAAESQNDRINNAPINTGAQVAGYTQQAVQEQPARDSLLLKKTTTEENETSSNALEVIDETKDVKTLENELLNLDSTHTTTDTSLPTDSAINHALIGQRNLFEAMQTVQLIAKKYDARADKKLEQLVIDLQKVHIDFGPNPYLGQDILPQQDTYFYTINVFNWRINLPPSRYGLGQFNRIRYRKKGINHYVKVINNENQLLYVGPFNSLAEVIDYQNKVNIFMPEIMKVPADMYNTFIITKPFLDTIADGINLFHYYQYYLEERARVNLGIENKKP